MFSNRSKATLSQRASTTSPTDDAVTTHPITVTALLLALAIDVMGADVVIEHFVSGEETKEDAVAVVDRVGPRTGELSFELMRSQAGIKGVGTATRLSLWQVLELKLGVWQTI